MTQVTLYKKTHVVQGIKKTNVSMYNESYGDSKAKAEACALTIFLRFLFTSVILLIKPASTT